ncbi:MAG: DUF3592 domain-containing protein [Archangium sp.]|nr:DUF3592 domain-containing protein [Archangium sp.]
MPAEVAVVVVDELVPGLVGLALALAGVVFFGRLIALSLLARSWPAVEGVVTSIVTRKAGRRLTGLQCTVTYEYVVGAQRHAGTQLWFGDTFDISHATAEAVRRRFREQQRLEVRYQPSNPSRATIDARAGWLTWAGLAGSSWLVALLVNELFLKG